MTDMASGMKVSRLDYDIPKTLRNYSIDFSATNKPTGSVDDAEQTENDKSPTNKSGVDLANDSLNK